MRQQLVGQGFTLIEISMVLLIIGILASSLAVPMAEKLGHTQYRQTDEYLRLANEALYGFALEQGRLPCPAKDEAGLESNTPCLTQGWLPWKTLGLRRDDAWGQTLRYFADSKLTQLIKHNTQPANGFKVVDSDGNALTGTVAAIIFSTGANQGRADETDHEKDNRLASSGTIYAKSTPLPPANGVDDSATWISPIVLKNHLARQGRL